MCSTVLIHLLQQQLSQDIHVALTVSTLSISSSCSDNSIRQLTENVDRIGEKDGHYVPVTAAWYE